MNMNYLLQEEEKTMNLNTLMKDEIYLPLTREERKRKRKMNGGMNGLKKHPNRKNRPHPTMNLLVTRIGVNPHNTRKECLLLTKMERMSPLQARNSKRKWKEGYLLHLTVMNRDPEPNRRVNLLDLKRRMLAWNHNKEEVKWGKTVETTSHLLRTLL